MRSLKQSLVGPWLAAFGVAGVLGLGGCGDGIGRPIVGSGPHGQAGRGVGGIAGTNANGGLGGVGGLDGSSDAGGRSGLGALGGLGGGGRGVAGGAPSSAGSMGMGARMGQGGCQSMDGRGGPPNDSFDVWPNDCTGQAGDPGASPDDVPDSDYCQDVVDWDDTAACFEAAVLAYVNEMRATGSPCGSGSTGTLRALVMQPALRCSARLHSKDLSEGRPNGDNLDERLRRVDYSHRVASESSVQWDQGDPMDRSHGLDNLFASGGPDTGNLFASEFDSVGVGLDGDYLTLDFAGP
ncbi:MAG TPA: hypothetical protein VGQ57_19780 [Polyangiaceae bacterium]|nr:hypothetical protein [Polyangiaceae bacterium]